MRSLLFTLVAFTAVTSTLSGLLMVSDPSGSILSLSTRLLEGSPFKDYLIPGILLAVVVGGINLAAVFSNLQRGRNRYNWSMAGGIVISGWILVQMLLIRTVHWLHLVYLGIGLLIVLISSQLKGKWAV